MALFVSEGAKWISEEPRRLAAFQRLAARGGGLAGLHWGIGTRQAKNIDAYLSLLGGCHGGPDRKYTVVTARVQPATPGHPVLRGLTPFSIRDEFYYRLKFALPLTAITPLLRVPIEGESHTVAWAWQRPDKGRSFGFSGLHFHVNWRHAQYQRLIAQAVLWTMKLPVPKGGVRLQIKPKALELRRR